VVEEVARIRKSSVSILFVLRHHLLFPWIVVIITATAVSVAIVEDHDLIYAKDGERTGYLADEGSLLIMGLAAVKC